MERTTHTNRLGTDPATQWDTPRDTPIVEQTRTIRPSRTESEGFAHQVQENSIPLLLGALAAGFILRRVLGSSEEETTRQRKHRKHSRHDRSSGEDHDLLLAWLNDAYAMEKAQIPVLENHAKDAKEYPKIRKRDLQHLEETRRHAEMVKDCIERLGGKASTSKVALGKLIGHLGSVSTGPFEDELVKNFLSDYAVENLEIASYQTIITAAQELGDRETVRVCKKILKDEESMAEWLEDNLPMAVRETLRNH